MSDFGFQVPGSKFPAEIVSASELTAAIAANPGPVGPKGDTGATGATGATGSSGSTGPSGVISVSAEIVNSGTSTSANLSLRSRAFTHNASRSVSTTNNTANGFQLSATRDADVCYSASISTTATIGGPSSGTILLEICSTNASSGASWQTIASFTNIQTITLAVVLQSVQAITSPLRGIVPAGFYARVRSLAPSGTITYSTTVSGQEVLL